MQLSVSKRRGTLASLLCAAQRFHALTKRHVPEEFLGSTSAHHIAICMTSQVVRCRANVYTPFPGWNEGQASASCDPGAHSVTLAFPATEYVPTVTLGVVPGVHGACRAGKPEYRTLHFLNKQRPVAHCSRGCRDRVMGNPRFLRVLAVEVVLGCTAKTIAEVQARGAKIWEELDFLASDLSLEARAPRRTTPVTVLQQSSPLVSCSVQ